MAHLIATATALLPSFSSLLLSPGSLFLRRAVAASSTPSPSVSVGCHCFDVCAACDLPALSHARALSLSLSLSLSPLSLSSLHSLYLSLPSQRTRHTGTKHKQLGAQHAPLGQQILYVALAPVAVTITRSHRRRRCGVLLATVGVVKWAVRENFTHKFHARIPCW